MSTSTKRVPKNRAQLDLSAALRNFIKSPLKGLTLERLCRLIAEYELDARFLGTIESVKATETARAEVKAEDICRDCRVKLVDANRARVVGYQCLDCKRKYTRENAARRRAALKAAIP